MAESQSRPLNIEHQIVEGVPVLKISGSAGMAGVQKLREGLNKVLDLQAPIVVLDVSDMDFISSAGLAELINAELKSKKQGGIIRMVYPKPAVLEIFETTRLTKVIPIYSSLEEAMEGCDES